MESLLATFLPGTQSPGSIATATYDGSHWSEPLAIQDQPGHITVEGNLAPSAVTFNNWTFLIYPGDSNYTLYCTWFDGSTWHGGVPIHQMNGGIDPRSTRSPGIVVYRGMLMISYVLPNTTEIRTAWFDGSSWLGDEAIKDQNGGIDPNSPTSSAMCVYGDELHLVYRSHNLAYTCTFNGIYWEGDTNIADQPGHVSPASVYQIAAVVFQSQLFLVWTDGPTKQAYSATFDGTSWSGGNPISSQAGHVDLGTCRGPVLDVLAGKLILLFQSDQNSNVAMALFDGATWSGGAEISFPPNGQPLHSFGSRQGATILASPPPQSNTWLAQIPGATKISAINIPGTHDSAAINSLGIRTLYACHNRTITEQLESGIRLLDVRLQIRSDGQSFVFYTCHSDLGSSIGINVYQSFESLMDECKAFLQANPSEFVLMSLKVDDWEVPSSQRSPALTALHRMVYGYPVATSYSSLPTVDAIRGKIYLFNRITSDQAFGVPLGWADNTSGQLLPVSSKRPFPIYVQDQYKGLNLIGSEQQKCDLVTAAFTHATPTQAVWNFASATWFGVMGVYIGECLLNYFGSEPASSRPSLFGWVLMDYSTNQFNSNTYGAMNLVSFIISANFGYGQYPDPFQVRKDGHDEL